MTLQDSDVIAKLQTALLGNRTDVLERNTYIATRDRVLYDVGLLDGLDMPSGFDRTLHNFLPRAVDIHTAQLMGQGVNMYSYYEKEDVSVFTPDDKQDLEAAELSNKTRQTKAYGRKNLIDAMIRDNGGVKLFKNGARVGSAYGSTLYQTWWDDDKKMIRIELLENIQNWYPLFSDNSFRTREGDAYLSQMSINRANRLYGDMLSDGEEWPTSLAGDPLVGSRGDFTSTGSNVGTTTSSPATRELMVTKYNYTGYLPRVAYDKKGNFTEVDYGKETLISFEAIGNHVVSKITDEDYMPKIYYIPNRVVPRRPYGESDIPESAIEINKTYIQRMSGMITLSDKTLFPLGLAKGYDLASIPLKRTREMQIVPALENQSIDFVQTPQQVGLEERIINELMNNLLTVLGIPKVLFFEPAANPSSNQALLSTMRPIIDIVEDKQSNWEPVLREMFTDALNLAAKHNPDVKAVLEDESDSFLYVRWPAIMRKDDPAHQVSIINKVNAGLMSVDTAMEELGIPDVQEEQSRLRDNMKDATKAAILGKMLGQLAHFTIYESLGIPLYGFNQPKITLKGDLTPEQEGNLAQNQGFNDGPFGASMGPQGNAGTVANDNFINAGQIQGNPYDGGIPTHLLNGVHPATPGTSPAGAPGGTPGSPSPMLTPGQNQPHAMPMSQPGLSAPTSTTPTGAVNQTNQRRGR